MFDYQETKVSDRVHEIQRTASGAVSALFSSSCKNLAQANRAFVNTAAQSKRPCLSKVSMSLGTTYHKDIVRIL